MWFKCTPSVEDHWPVRGWRVRGVDQVWGPELFSKGNWEEQPEENGVTKPKKGQCFSTWRKISQTCSVLLRVKNWKTIVFCNIGIFGDSHTKKKAKFLMLTVTKVDAPACYIKLCLRSKNKEHYSSATTLIQLLSFYSCTVMKGKSKLSTVAVSSSLKQSLPRWVSLLEILSHGHKLNQFFPLS